MKNRPVAVKLAVKFTGEEVSALFGAALPGGGGAHLFGLLEAVALGTDLDDVSAMDEAVDGDR